jgi:chromosome segregation ATPase
VNTLSLETISERISKVEQITEHHSQLLHSQGEKLESQNDKNETLAKLTTLVEIQMQDSRDREARQETRDEKQNLQMKEFSDTLVKVNENLTGLNSSVSQVESRVGKLEDSQKKKIIDLGELAKDVVFKVIPTLIGAYLILKFGLK